MPPSPFGSILPRADCTLDVGTTKPEGQPRCVHFECMGIARAGTCGLECPQGCTRPLVMLDGAGAGKRTGGREPVLPLLPHFCGSSMVSGYEFISGF